MTETTQASTQQVTESGGLASPAIAQGKAVVTFLGNCQVNKLSLMTKLDNPNYKVRFHTITEFWGTFQPELAEKEVREADIVVCQLVLSPGYVFFHEKVRAMSRDRVVFTPYVYIDGFGALEVVSSKGVNRVQGMEHLVGPMAERPRGQVVQRFLQNEYDMKVGERFRRSVDEMRYRENQGADVKIADYIADTHRERPVAYAINHPLPHVLDHMYAQLTALLGAKRVPYEERGHFDSGRLHLPLANRAFTPWVVEELGLEYPHDTHWYSSSVKLAVMVFNRIRQQGGTVID